MVQKGEVIVAKGSVINDEIYQKLESYKKAFEDNARVNGDRRLVLLGQFLLVAIVIMLADGISYTLFRRDIYDDNRLVSLILLVVTAMLAYLIVGHQAAVAQSYIIFLIVSYLSLSAYCLIPVWR